MNKILRTLTVFLSLQLVAQEKELPVYIRDSLDNYIIRGMEAWRIPGLY